MTRVGRCHRQGIQGRLQDTWLLLGSSWQREGKGDNDNDNGNDNGHCQWLASAEGDAIVRFLLAAVWLVFATFDADLAEPKDR